MKPPEQLRWRLLQRPIPIVEIPWHSSLMERRSCNSLNTVLAGEIRSWHWPLQKELQDWTMSYFFPLLLMEPMGPLMRSAEL